MHFQSDESNLSPEGRRAREIFNYISELHNSSSRREPRISLEDRVQTNYVFSTMFGMMAFMALNKFYGTGFITLACISLSFLFQGKKLVSTGYARKGYAFLSVGFSLAACGIIVNGFFRMTNSPDNLPIALESTSSPNP